MLDKLAMLDKLDMLDMLDKLNIIFFFKKLFCDLRL